jgi:hypothetical protein
MLNYDFTIVKLVIYYVGIPDQKEIDSRFGVRKKFIIFSMELYTGLLIMNTNPGQIKCLLRILRPILEYLITQNRIS